MTAYLHWIVDIILVLALLFFYLRGHKKGFILTLCGLAAFFVALFGARFLSQQLSPMFADAMTPHFTAMVEEKVDGELLAKTEQFLTSAEEDGGVLVSILKSIGLYDSFADSVRDLLGKQATQLVTDTAAALAHAIAEAVVGVVIFIVAFLLILLLWSVLSRILNLAAKLPILHSLNGLLGGLLGLVQGALILFLVAWLLRLLGIALPAELVESSTVLKFFVSTNPISIFAGI